MQKTMPDLDPRKPKSILIDAEVTLVDDMAANFYTMIQVLEGLGHAQDDALAYLICAGVRSEMERMGMAFSETTQSHASAKQSHASTNGQ